MGFRRFCRCVGYFSSFSKIIDQDILIFVCYYGQVDCFYDHADYYVHASKSWENFTDTIFCVTLWQLKKLHEAFEGLKYLY